MSEQYYTNIQIFFAARSLLNVNRPFLKIYLKTSADEDLQFVGQTNQADNFANPTWKIPIKSKYFFQFKQKFQVQLYQGNNEQCVAVYHTFLNQLINKQDYIMGDLFDSKDSSPRGKIIIQVDTIHDSQYSLLMKWRATGLKNVKSFFDCIQKDNPYLKFSKKRKNNTLAFATETMPIFSSLQPKFDAIQVPVWRLFSPYVEDPEVKVQCFSRQQNHKDQFIGDCYFKCSDLSKNPLKINLINTEMFGNPGWIVLDYFEKVPTPSFIDYLQSGLQLHLSLSLDFTGSNSPYTISTSLHFVNENLPQNKNPYQKIISAVYEILSGYDFDQFIHVFGFGAKPKFPNLQSDEVSHYFPLTGDQMKPYVKGIQQLEEAYINTLKNVVFSGPTCFAPILKEAFKAAEPLEDKYDYMVMLIITDGTIHDFEETVFLINKNCHLPISLIIVGVGNEDFSQMKKIETYPFNRPCIEFIEYSKIGQNSDLASDLLSFIPNQIIQYMIKRKIIPQPKKKLNLMELIFHKVAPQLQQ